MALSPLILGRVSQLGATHGAPELDMESALRSLRFPHPLIEAETLEGNISPDEAKDWLATEGDVFPEHRPRFVKTLHIRTFDDHLFSPFTEGTSDYNGWDVDETYFRTRVAAPTLEFIEIGFEDGGYPDLFYVCLSDPEQTNPQVYATDSGESWQRIWQEGDLLAFLNRYLTPAELTANLEVIASRLA